MVQFGSLSVRRASGAKGKRKDMLVDSLSGFAVEEDDRGLNSLQVRCGDKEVECFDMR